MRKWNSVAKKNRSFSSYFCVVVTKKFPSVISIINADTEKRKSTLFLELTHAGRIYFKAKEKFLLYATGSTSVLHYSRIEFQCTSVFK